MSPIASLIIMVLLLAMNAFFVAGEFATTTSRRSQIEPLVEQGKRGSRQALHALKNVSHMLSICQLGVTVASTTLGVVAEPAIADLVAEPLTSVGLPAASAHVVGFVVALLLVVYLHVVFGEMVPKNISIAMPPRMLLLLAPPLVAFGKVVEPVIWIMDHVANGFVRLAGLTPRSEISSSFTTGEVASIVEESEREGKISDDLGLLSGTLEFSDKTAGQVMVAIERVECLPRGCTPEQVEHAVAVTGYSRFPVSDDNDEIVGYLHLKDVLYAEGAERDQAVPASRIRRTDRVRATQQIDDAMQHMQRNGAHLAEVTDEQDQVIGVLFLEDILEELVGEVQDTLQRA